MASGLKAQIAIIASGTALAQGINLLGVLIVARILVPADFGAFALSMAIATPIAILSTGRYEASMIAANSRKAAANLLALSMLTSMLASCLLWIALSVAGFSSTAAVVGILILGMAWFSCTTHLDNYLRNYKLIATSRIVGAVAAQGVTISLAFLVSGPVALGLGTAIGLLSSVMVSAIGNKQWLMNQWGAVSLPRAHLMARRYVSYLIFNGPQALASALQESAAVALITIYFGQSAAGLYNLMNRLMRAPLSILAESVGRVLQRQAADIKRSKAIGSLGDFLRRALILLYGVSALFWLAAYVLADPVVSFAFGREWSSIGALMKAGAIYYAGYIVAASIAAIPLGTGDHRLVAPVGIAGSFLYVGSITVAGVIYADFASGFALVAITMFLYFICFCAVVYLAVTRRTNAP